MMQGHALCGWLRKAAFLAVIAARCGAQQPDPVEVIKTAVANFEKGSVLLQAYTFQTSIDWTYYD